MKASRPVDGVGRYGFAIAEDWADQFFVIVPPEVAKMANWVIDREHGADAIAFDEPRRRGYYFRHEGPTLIYWIFEDMPSLDHATRLYELVRHAEWPLSDEGARRIRLKVLAKSPTA